MTGFFLFGKGKAQQPKKRSPRFAGTWYEDDARQLKEELSGYLKDATTTLKDIPCASEFADNVPPEEGVLAIVSPHAGYAFSGRTAAFAYSLAQRERIKRVFLLGPSHYIGFSGAALSDDEVFGTPLGDLEVDREVVNELRDFPLFKTMADVHRREHSLEMQLPLIKACLGDVKIIPAVVGILEDEVEARLVGEGLRRFVREGDLIVVSSDFCHVGPRYQYQPFRTNLRANILKLDNEAYQHMSRRDLEGFFAFREKTGATICGFYPCCVLMSMLPADTTCSVLSYATSQDSIVEDDNNSVSYMAVGFSRKPENGVCWTDSTRMSAEEEATALAENERQALLSVARQTLESFVKNRSSPEISEQICREFPRLLAHRGVFVTLFKKKGNTLLPDRLSKGEDHDNRELRGCIGHIWPVRPLLDGVVENAIGACSRDFRFKPVTRAELGEIQLEISVLTPLRRIDSYNEIVLGRDGIVMYRNGCQAVFLPHVAEQFGWTLQETLTQLSIKAGCGPNGWKTDARFDVFQAESFEEPA